MTKQKENNPNIGFHARSQESDLPHKKTSPPDNDVEELEKRRAQFDPRMWMAALNQKRQMDDFVQGTYDPGSSAFSKLQSVEVGLFLSDRKDKVVVQPDKNLDEGGSFGFVGSFAQVSADSSYIPGTLILRFDAGNLHGVARDTLSLFIWNERTNSYRIVSKSGVGAKGDYVWGRVTEPGRYAVVGLHAHPLIARTNRIAETLSDLTRGLDPDLRTKIGKRVCNLILDIPELRKAIEEPQTLENLVAGSLVQGLPNPLQAWKPNPGFMDIWDLQCPPMSFDRPEWDISSRGTGASLFADPGWQNVGPTNIGGPTLQVIIDPQNNDRLYAVAASGGLWRLDSIMRYPRTTWAPLTDQQQTLALRAVAVPPSNNSVVYYADYFNKLLRSEDRGRSWSITSDIDLGQVRKIIVSPSDPDFLFLATSTGLWRSRDGGATWDSTPGQTSFYDGDITDIAMDPGAASILYMAVRRVGLLKSTTSGRTWHTMFAWDPGHSYWTPEPGNPMSTMMLVSLGRLGTDATRTVAVKFGQEVFVNNNGGRPPGTSGGGSWRSLGKPTGVVPSDGQGDWDHVIAVDPFDNNAILAGAQELYLLTNRGQSWRTVVPYYTDIAHVDQHSIAFDATQRGVVYLSNDGGVFRSSDGGQTWHDMNNGLITAELFDTGIGGDQAVGGMNHQGISASSHLSGRLWTAIEGGTWEFTNVFGDQRRPNYFYTLGGSLGRRRFPGRLPSDFNLEFGSFASTAVAVDPAPPSNVMLAGAANPVRIMRTLDCNPDHPAWTAETVTGIGTDAITSIAFAPSRPGMAYAGSSSGQVFRKTNVGQEGIWEYRGRWNVTGVKQILVNPMHEDRIYLINGSQVARSDDGGGTWVIANGAGTNGLPNSLFRALVAYPADGETLFLAANIGVFLTQDEGHTWLPYDRDLPNADVGEIVWANGYLYAMTFGRGLWRRRPYFGAF